MLDWLCMTNGKIRVGIIMGGPSSEYEVSLASGENIFNHLDRRLFEPVKIKILRDGKIWTNGRYAKLEKAVKSVDLCFLATHGEFGEDGRLQAILESYGVSYTGSGVLASALAMNKAKSRQFFSINGLRTPKTLFIKESESSQAQLKFFVNKIVKMPVMVKPCSRGSSVGVSIVRRKSRLNKAIQNAFKYDPEVLIEEYISGREFTCGVIERKVNGSTEVTALPVTEIIPGENYSFFDYEAKYSPGAAEEITPAPINDNLAKEIEAAAVKAHTILGCQDYSRSDFLVKKGKIYILEVNTLPGLTLNSLIPKGLKAAGLSMKRFLSNICFRHITHEEFVG